MSRIVRRVAGPMLAGVFAVALAAFGSQAHADTISFYLNQAECPGGVCNAGNVPALLASPPTEVIVTTTAGSAGDWTQATVEFLAITGTINTPVYINVNGGILGTSTVLGYKTGCAAGCTVGGITGPGSEDQFGTFSNGTGAVQNYTSVIFTLNSATSWATAASVLKLDTGFSSFYQSANGDPGFMAVEGGAQVAGWYAPGQGAPGDTPLPATLPLFVSGLGTLGMLTWRRKRKMRLA